MSEGKEDSYSSFPNTSWTIVREAGAMDGEALASLLERYLPALRSRLVVTRRIPEAEADDLLQSFVSCKFLEQNLAGQANQSKGRFRTLVLTVLDRFLIDQRRHAAATKRGGDVGPPVDVTNFDVPDPWAERPDDAFDIEWARGLLDEAMLRMETECRAAGRDDIWGVFRGRLIAPILDAEPVMGYEQLVERYGFRSPTQAANALTTAKRLFRRTLRALVAEYADTPEAIDAEFDDLLSILSRPSAGMQRGGRIDSEGSDFSDGQ